MNAIKKFIYSNIVPAIGAITANRNRYVNVIYYHDVVDGPGESYMKINIEKFKRHMFYLRDHGWQTIRFDDLQSNDDCRIDSGRKRVLITFDDGWRSNYDAIFEFMNNNGLKYNIFLETAKIGNDPNYLSWDLVRKMHQSGTVGFGAHTFSHPNMADVTALDLDRELTLANDIIRRETGIEARDFCFPFGAYSADSIDKIRRYGLYDRIYTSDMRYSYPIGDTLIFGRNAISDAESFGVFKAKLKGRFNVWHLLFNR